MTRTNILMILVSLMGLFLFSCTKLEEPFVSTKTTKIVDTIMNWDTVHPVRKVLLEDYTGHKCVNCPEAAVIAHGLEGLYGGKLILMAVHAGWNAAPSQSGEFTANYTTPAGEVWDKDLGINGTNPQGLVDRKVFGSSMVLSKDAWGAAVSEIIGLPPDAFIVIDNKFTSSTGTLNTTVYTKFINPKSGTVRLCLCVVEDSLRSPQKNNNPAVGTVPVIEDYLFMHVMRGAINGTYGEVLTTSVNPTHTYIDRVTITLNAAWKPKNCWLYAFVFDDATKEIYQVERKKISL